VDSSTHDAVGGRSSRSPAGMSITIVDPGCTVALSGRLCAATVAEVRLALGDAMDCGVGDLVVDLGGVEMSDATGLGVLVGTHRRALREDRRLVLRDVPERIERLLAVTRLHRVLSVEPSVDIVA
jgi:anti-sigma B factor antagonist